MASLDKALLKDSMLELDALEVSKVSWDVTLMRPVLNLSSCVHSKKPSYSLSRCGSSLNPKRCQAKVMFRPLLSLLVTYFHALM
jgi:hypothetical protein